MSFGLKLLPIDYDNGTLSWSHTVLNCDLNSSTAFEFHGLLRPHQIAVTAGFTSYLSTENLEGCECEESHYGETPTDSYGEPLCWVEVKHLLYLSDHEEISGLAWHKNKAVWAYLAQLPPLSKIALYWD